MLESPDLRSLLAVNVSEVAPESLITRWFRSCCHLPERRGDGIPFKLWTDAECTLGGGAAGGDFAKEREELSCSGAERITGRVWFRALGLMHSCLALWKNYVSEERFWVRVLVRARRAVLLSGEQTPAPVAACVCCEGKSVCLSTAFKHCDIWSHSLFALF